MKRFDLWKLSLLNVFCAPVRSLLTVLGFAIGVAAILAVLTLGDAGRRQVESEMARLGIDKVWLTAEDQAGLRQGDGSWLLAATGAQAEELVYVPILLEGGREERQATAVGCSLDYVLGLRITDGTAPFPLHWQKTGQTAVLGERVAGELGIEAGQDINIAGEIYRVCGLAAAEGVSSVALEEAVLLPLETVCEWTGGSIYEIQLTCPQGTDPGVIQRLAARAAEAGGLSVQATSMQVQMEAASSVIDTFVSVLGWVALVCILVGGVGVMNILLISVRERRREIGVMKSLGTTPRQIGALFLLEALVYALIGGLLGIVTGFGLIGAAGRSIELSARAGFGDCAFVFASALLVGVVFGVLPALRAARLSCVDALRQE